MDLAEKEEYAPPFPVLARMDRLDRLVQYLEEKNSIGAVIRKGGEPEDQYKKSLSSALEEVNQKGSLMNRLARIEERVFQLSLEINGGNNTSRSSSSTIDQTGKPRLGLDSTTLANKYEDITILHGHKQDPISLTRHASISAKEGLGKQQGVRNGATRTGVKVVKRKKWFGWCRLGC